MREFSNQQEVWQRKKVFSMKKRNSKRSKLRSCFNLHTGLSQTYLLPPLEQEKLKDGKPSIDSEL